MSDLDQELRSAGRSSGGGDGGYGVDLGQLESAAASAPAAPAASKKKKVASLGKGKRPGLKIDFSNLRLDGFLVTAAFVVVPPIALMWSMQHLVVFVPLALVMFIISVVGMLTVLKRLFEDGRAGAAVLSILLCLVVSQIVFLFHGWQNAREWRIRPLMLLWTGSGIALALMHALVTLPEKPEFLERYFDRVRQNAETQLDFKESIRPVQQPTQHDVSPAWPIDLSVPVLSIDYSRAIPQFRDSLHRRVVSEALRSRNDRFELLEDHYRSQRSACDDCTAVLEMIQGLDTAREFAPALVDEILRLSHTTIKLYSAKAALKEHERRILPATKRQADSDLYKVGEAYERVVKIRGVKAILEQELRGRDQETHYHLSRMGEFHRIVTFVSNHGPENIAIVFLMSDTPGTNWDPYYKSLQSIADNRAGRLHADAEADCAIIMLAPVADIREFERRLDFGEFMQMGFGPCIYRFVGKVHPGAARARGAP